MSDYSFIEAFATEVNKPLDKWDYAGGTAGGGDEFFKQLGELSRTIQDGKLTAADAVRTKALLQSFADGLNRISTALTSPLISIGNAQDNKFMQTLR